MKNSGLVSVGHLLNCKAPDEYKLTFQHFGTILQSNVCENTIYKLDSRWRFDQVRANSFKHRYSDGRSKRQIFIYIDNYFYLLLKSKYGQCLFLHFCDFVYKLRSNTLITD